MTNTHLARTHLAPTGDKWNVGRLRLVSQPAGPSGARVESAQHPEGAAEGRK